MKPLSGPVRPRDRILELDVLRGFALFGILLVNMDAFAWPITETRLAWADAGGAVDQVAGWLVRFLAQGKFFTLFSLLFGLGLAMQLSRAKSRGARFLPAYLRRMAVLLGFGLLHIHLLWAGDILTDYAVVGLVLLLFYRCRPVVLVRWAAVALVVSALLTTLLLWSAWPSWGGGLKAPAPAASAGLAGAFDESVGGTARSEWVRGVIDTYRHGTFAEMRTLRLVELRALRLAGVTFEPIVLAMFLLGLALGRSGFLEDLPTHLPRIARVGAWAAVIGAGANLAFVVLGDRARVTPSAGADWAGEIAFIIGGPTLMLAYASGLVVLLRKPAWRTRLAPLAAAGRMPLTNYLMQSVICTTIFYGYGLGLFGRVGIAPGLGLALAVYLVQVALSVWWMGRFEFGPLEWLWRTLSYARRLESPAVEGAGPA